MNNQKPDDPDWGPCQHDFEGDPPRCRKCGKKKRWWNR